MFVLTVCVVVRLAAAVWSLLLLWRHRDWRLLVGPLVTGGLLVEPLAKVLDHGAPDSGLLTAQMVAESIFALLIPWFLGHGFLHEHRTLVAARRNEELFRALAENSLGLICQHDLDGVLLFINAAAAGALGYRPEDVVGKSVREALAPAVRHEFDPYLQRIRRDGADSGLMRVLTRDKTERIWLYRNVIHEAPGAAPSVLGHALDITELKQAERQLRQAGEELEIRVKERTAELARFRSVMDQAEEAIFISDVETARFVDVNETACRLLGYSREELLRLGPIDIVLDYPLGCTEDWRRSVEQARSEGGRVVLPIHRHRRKDGSSFPVEVRNAYLTVEGGARILSVALDITEQKRAQEALREAEADLRQTTTSLSDYLWSADISPGGKLVYRYCSPVVEKITGRPAEFYMPGAERWLSTIHPQDLPKLEQWYARVCQDPPGQAEVEHRIVLPDGAVRWVRDSVTTTRLGNGVIRLYGVVSDISDRKNAEQQRQRLERQLRQAQRLESLGVLAGGIAHDFNNILTSILGFASLVEADLPQDSPQRANVQEVLRAGERAKQLVLRILTFSQRGGQERHPVDVAATVSEALRLMRGSIPPNVEIRQRIRQDCGDVVADSTSLHQLVVNLCTNAYHALEASGGVLEVSLEKILVDDQFARQHSGLNSGPYVKLTVCDDGPGVDPAVRDKIFDPFFTTKEIGKGTGLGLSMAHGIASSHGGVIELESGTRRGATFTVYLPLTAAECGSERSGAIA